MWCCELVADGLWFASAVYRLGFVLFSWGRESLSSLLVDSCFFFFFPPLPFFCEAAKKTSVAGRKIDKGLTNTISWKIFHFIATMHCLLYCKYLNTSSSEHAGRETGALWFQLRLVIDGIWCSKAEAWLTSAWTNCHCEVVSMWMGDYFSLALSDFVAVKCLSF